MPVSPLAPDTWAVYAPGGSVTRMAESALAAELQGKAPTAAAALATWALPAQAVLLSRTVEPEKSWSSGSDRVPVTPKGTSAGPDARISTVREVVPPIAKPAIRMLPPVPTCTRAEMLTIRGVAAV